MKKLIFFALFLFGTFINCQKNPTPEDLERIKNNLLPEKLTLSMSVVDFANVVYSLYRQNIIDDKNIPVVTTTNRKWHSKDLLWVGNYEDIRRRTSIAVEVYRINGEYKRKYFGSFAFGPEVFSLKPADENIIEGALKTYKTYIGGIEHIVSETENRVKFESDSELEKKRRSKRSLRRAKRQIKKNAVIEVLVVVDYSVYSTWLKYNSNKKDATIKNLMAYYSHIVMGIDNKFGSIFDSQYKYSVRLSGLYITENSRDSVSEKGFLRVGEKLNYDATLEELQSWVTDKKDVLPDHDVLAFFTKYKSTGTNTGLGALGSTCQKRSNSITLDVGVYGTADIAAHEIGHNMGANHDGEGNNCNPASQYLMTAVQTADAVNNHHTFSSCSINYFRQHVAKKESSCLFEHGVEFDTSDHKKKLLGTLFTLDEQCRHIKGPDSFFCSDGEDSDKGACSKIYCWNAKEKACMGGKDKAYEGTSCGNKQWCINSQCVRSSQAPANKEKCIHGEAKTAMRYNNVLTKCPQFASQRSACQSPVVSKRCCETCPKVTQANPSCPYGDKFNNCEDLKRSCGDMQLRKDCCDTCEKMKNPSTPHCLYGDSIGNCAEHPAGCVQANWRKQCCRTCDQIKKSNPPDCPYGDIYGNCAQLTAGCRNNQDIKTKCCKTCRYYG